MSSFASVTIDKFIGMNSSRDELSLIPGQLSKNNNYLYMASGGLRERGGGARLSSAPSAGNQIYSLSNYRNSSGSEFLICNQGTDAYYYNSGWQALSLTLTSNKKIRWAQAGKGSSTALYGVNANQGVIKISGTTPSAALVSNSPTSCFQIVKHKNRLFAIDKTTIYFTEVLDFDTWNTANNTIDIAPGVDGDVTGIEIWGDALFIAKEYGWYVIPNAADPVPKINWAVLRADAATGSGSTDSIRRTMDGIYFLSSDNFVRKLSPAISFSSGEYTLGGSGTPIVSVPIENDLEELLEDSKKLNAQAIVHNDLYILSFQTVNNASTYNDITYFADTAKHVQFEGVATLQPYWGKFSGFDYDFFTQQLSSGKVKLYGAKGSSTAGEVHETLNDSIHNDNSAAIRSKAILGWFPVGGESLYKKMKQVYFVGETENWAVNIILKAYKFGQIIPSEGEGNSYTYQSTTAAQALVGTAVVGTAVLSSISVGSSKFRTSLKGHMLRAEMENLNADEFTRIDKMIVYYRPIKNK